MLPEFSEDEIQAWRAEAELPEAREAFRGARHRRTSQEKTPEALAIWVQTWTQMQKDAPWPRPVRKPAPPEAFRL